MDFKRFFIYIFVLVGMCLVGIPASYAQRTNTDSLARVREQAAAARQKSLDSMRAERQRVLDSSNAARQKSLDIMRAERQRIQDSSTASRQRILDSSRASRQRILDSSKASRERIADSLAFIREYRESKDYKDSVASARQTRLDNIREVRQVAIDSARDARQQVIDSATASRKQITDSIRAVAKQRSDSLAIIRKYRESDRYADSVAVVRQERLDSVKAVRKAFNDSAIAERKRVIDSATASRKQIADSATASRKVISDSLAAIRKIRTDSLAAAKVKREEQQKVRQKLRDEKNQLAFQLKIKKKRQAYSNENMLKKRWSVPRKVIQNTFTRYNYYFNADQKMDEALENMQRIGREDYDSLIALFPFDPDIDSSRLAPDMDSIIQKASLGIQIHDPRTKWGDDLYLLLGQAYYYKGDYNNAITSFRYVISLRERYKKQEPRTGNSSTSRTRTVPSIAEEDKGGALDFLKHRSVHNEAILWLSRTYVESHQEGNAESVLDLLDADPNLPDNIKGRLALEKAYLALNQNNKREAITQLKVVAADGNLPDWVRQRAGYLNGQLLQEQGNYRDAAASFEQVLDMNPKIEMDFYSRKNLAYNLMLSGQDQESAFASLKRVLNDGKYAPYYEQVYYVMGRLSANNNRNEEAIEYLQAGLASSKSTRKQKALSFAALGNVYYATGQYNNAKVAYDSAAVMASAAGPNPDINTAIRRGAALSVITGPANTIRIQDSLLALAGMTERDQRSNARQYIRLLQDRRADSIYMAENAGLTAAANAQANANEPTSPNAPMANWYFGNAALMQQGYNSFKSKWGNRPLADNWRRSSAPTFGTGNNAIDPSTAYQDDNNTGPVAVDEFGIPTEDALLAGIPNTSERQETSRQRIQKAYVALANGYVKQLEDYPAATRTIDTLDKRFPNHPDKAEMLYLRYLTALRQNELPKAQGYSAQILQQYAETKWANLVRPTEDGANMPVAGTTVANYYDAAYVLMMQRQYAELLPRAREGQRLYNDPKYDNRFRIMEAIALAGTGEYNAADTMLTQFINANGNDSLRTWAEATLKYVKASKAAATPPPPAAPVTTAPATPGTTTPPTAPATTPAPATPPPPAPVTPPATTAANDTTGGGVPYAVASEAPPPTYTYKPTEVHYVVFAFNSMESRAMGVKAAITDFNTFKFGNQGLVTNVEMIQPKRGVVITKSFQTAAQARIYFNALRGTSQVFREYRSNEYNLFLISAKNYAKLVTDKDVEAYLQFYRNSYK